MTRELRALEQMAAIGSTSLELLLEATTRPEISLAGLSRVCVESLLRGMAGAVAPLAEDDTVPEATRAHFARLAERFRAYERATENGDVR